MRISVEQKCLYRGFKQKNITRCNIHQRAYSTQLGYMLKKVIFKLA